MRIRGRADKCQSAQAPCGHEDETIDRRRPFWLQGHVPIDRGKSDGKDKEHHARSAEQTHVLGGARVRSVVLLERPLVQKKCEREPDSEIDNSEQRIERKVQIRRLALEYWAFCDPLWVGPGIKATRTKNDGNK